MKNKKKILSGFIFSLLMLGIISPLLSQSTFVTIDDPFKLDLDDAYIEVYVYDELTINPVQGADVWLYDDVYTNIDFGTTDIDGFYNFTGLSLGLYYIDIFASGYEYNDSAVTIDYEDEGEYVEFYLVNVFVPGNGFIDVYVYDFETTNPIVGAAVLLYSENWYYITDDITNSDGFCNFTGLGAATYNIEASAFDYHYLSDYVTIDFDGEGEYL
ncbi:MAG: carboxypeptidase regulatory-like domain-containing protein, partial [Candidatus Heimdallarchaeota archaeon]|nr:carboxypeptidase regulatory-like domain-containing protein [Candidatus Heimdallarchaeota archaeon]MCK4611552.1 carboxypeptidase regulatory-like domain-containing protein [Candidatus Heimdallarchaeota archaeon]